MKPTKRTTAIAAFALTSVVATPCAFAATGSGSLTTTIITTLAFLLIAGLAVAAFIGWTRSMAANMALREELLDLKLRTGFLMPEHTEEPFVPAHSLQSTPTIQFPAQQQAQPTMQFPAQPQVQPTMQFPAQAPVQQVQFAPAAMPVQPVAVGYAPVVQPVAIQPAFSAIPGSYAPRDIENITELKAQKPKLSIDPTDLLTSIADNFPQYLDDIRVTAPSTGAHVAKHQRPQPVNVLIAKGGKSTKRANIVELSAM